jgi:hypothetical protein
VSGCFFYPIPFFLMEAFDHLFDSHFADAQRSLTNTLAGFVDHATRLDAHLPDTGPLAAVLKAAQAETQALSTRAQATQQALGLSLGSQKQGTAQTATATTTALDRIRKNEATLRGDSLIEDEAERRRLYALLYPSGLRYYTAARLGTELADRLSEYLTRAEAEQKALGEAFVQRTRTALGPFRKTRETQVAGLSGTSTAREDRHELVDLLDAQCDYNYHLLSAHFRQDPTRPATYWNPTYYLRATIAPAVPKLP